MPSKKRREAEQKSERDNLVGDTDMVQWCSEHIQMENVK